MKRSKKALTKTKDIAVDVKPKDIAVDVKPKVPPLPDWLRVDRLDDRPIVLVPPGIGDSYWSIVKMRAFMRREGLGVPYVAPLCHTDPIYHGEIRNLSFLEMLPFIKSLGKAIDPGYGEAVIQLLDEAYSKPGRTLYRDVFGCDYLLSYNGHVANGAKLEEVDDLECDWFPEMIVTQEQEEFRLRCLNKYGKYILYYFPFYGFYINWLKEFNTQQILESVLRLTEETGCRAAFIGASWDVGLSPGLGEIIAQVPNAIDLRGQTTLHQAFGLLRGAQLFIGHQAGIGMMGNILGTKTLLIWHNCINYDMAINCMPPSTVGKTYFVARTHEMTVDNLVGQAKDILSL